MFSEPPRSRTPRTLGAILGALVLLAVGLWFGGHPSWLPGPLRSVFTSESKSERLQNQVFGLLTRDYYRKLSRTALVDKGLQGAVASLDDPYSHYYDPSDYHAFQNSTTNPTDDGGIGVGIDPDPNRGLLITEVYPGSPAARAGLRAGELIVAADGRSLATLDETAAAKLVRGQAGTSVRLTVTVIGRRRGRGHARTVRVRRTNLTVPVASSRVLHDHGQTLGYVRLTMFSQGAGAEVRNQVAKVRRAGARAIILDLRENGGGLVREAVNTASIFIPDGTIVSTKGRAQPRQVYMAEGNAIPTSIPIVVLVNQDTASAAEILTAALKQRGRATVVGTHTYGKGVFQEIMPLMNGGALDFTVGHYYTPDGQNLGGMKGVERGRGVLPNVYAGGGFAHQLRVAERTVLSKLR